jgi:hypothetical protein
MGNGRGGESIYGSKFKGCIRRTRFELRFLKLIFCLPANQTKIFRSSTRVRAF